ncbi:MAG: hypothetical protein HQL99_17415 [Magnetococcales bacterium]|nr:hypothetical protein [Magnetococcales bacterium]
MNWSRAKAPNELELATKKNLQVELAPLKWGMAGCVAGIVTLILQSFFPH